MNITAFIVALSLGVFLVSFAVFVMLSLASQNKRSYEISDAMALAGLFSFVTAILSGVMTFGAGTYWLLDVLSR